MTQASLNERLKLIATALNNLGLASIVYGAIAPYFHSEPVTWWQGLVAVLVGLGFHLVGQAFLGGIR